MLRHNPGTPSQNDPCQHGTDQGVANADPCGGNPIFPTELPGITYEDDGGEIGGPVGEGGEPGAYGAPAEYETIYIRRMFTAVKADSDHNGKKDNQHRKFQDHNIPPFLFRRGFGQPQGCRRNIAP